MKKLIAVAVLFLASLMLLSVSVQAESTPYIILDYIPQYGELGYFEGYITTNDNSDINYKNYRVTLYLQLSENGFAYVKPYYDQPYETIHEDGSFKIRYTTGGTDELATNIHILLIPSTFTPDDNFKTAKKYAIDTVDVTRTSKGEITVLPNMRTSEEIHSANPFIVVTEIPKFGSISPVCGYVSGTNIKYSDYRISTYVQIEPGERVWPKPTFAVPFSEIDNDGFFEAIYATGGMDNEAKIIHLLLIDSDFMPTEVIEDTIANAVDYVLITRDTDGSISMQKVDLQH